MKIETGILTRIAIVKVMVNGDISNEVDRPKSFSPPELASSGDTQSTSFQRASIRAGLLAATCQIRQFPSPISVKRMVFGPAGDKERI